MAKIIFDLTPEQKDEILHYEYAMFSPEGCLAIGNAIIKKMTEGIDYVSREDLHYFSDVVIDICEIVEPTHGEAGDTDVRMIIADTLCKFLYTD